VHFVVSSLRRRYSGKDTKWNKLLQMVFDTSNDHLAFSCCNKAHEMMMMMSNFDKHASHGHVARGAAAATSTDASWAGPNCSSLVGHM